MSVIASHMGITASPVSAATATVLTVLGPSGVQLGDILLVCIPATLIGVLAGVWFASKRGKDLSEDPEFLERMKDPVFVKLLEGEEKSATSVLKAGAVRSAMVFALAVPGWSCWVPFRRCCRSSPTGSGRHLVLRSAPPERCRCRQ